MTTIAAAAAASAVASAVEPVRKRRVSEDEARALIRSTALELGSALFPWRARPGVAIEIVRRVAEDARGARWTWGDGWRDGRGGVVGEDDAIHDAGIERGHRRGVRGGEGKIRAVGLSEVSADTLRRALGELEEHYEFVAKKFDDASWVGSRLAELLPILQAAGFTHGRLLDHHPPHRRDRRWLRRLLAAVAQRGPCRACRRGGYASSLRSG